MINFQIKQLNPDVKSGSRNTLYFIIRKRDNVPKPNLSRKRLKRWVLFNCLIGIFIFCLGFSGAFAAISVKVGESGEIHEASGSTSHGISIGYYTVGTREVTILSWHPDFGIGPWKFGLDFNLPLKEDAPEGIENVVLRFAEYDDGQKGLRYGLLYNVTYGKGLLMKNYTTQISGQLIPQNEQMGLKGYILADRVGFYFMGTRSNVYAIRPTYRVHPMVILGATYVTDTDGKSILQPDGTTKEYPSVTGVGIDASVPLPLGFEGYAEYAQLLDYGKGVGLGVNWGFDAFLISAIFDCGYRFLDSNFIPGYFNADYETNPVDIASAAATSQPKDGYFTEFQAKFADVTNLYVNYENYRDGGGSLMAAASSQFQNIVVSAYYKQPNFADFRSISYEEGAIAGGKIAYKINPYTTTVVHYKKAYDPSKGEVVESKYYEILFSL